MNFREQRKSKIFVLSVIFLILIGSVLHFVCGKLLYCNMTNSAVRGLYAAAPNQNLARGDYVIVRLPEGIESLHVDAGFRLLKRVRGFPGESYTVDEEYLRTQDDSYRIYHKDGLPQLKAGRCCYSMTPMIRLIRGILGQSKSRRLTRRYSCCCRMNHFCSL